MVVIRAEMKEKASNALGALGYIEVPEDVNDSHEVGDLLVTTEDEETNQRHYEKRVVFQSVARGYRSTHGKRQIYHVLLNTSMLEGEQEDDLEIMSEMYLKDGPLGIKNDIMMLSIGSGTISLVILDVVCEEEEWQYCFREGDGYITEDELKELDAMVCSPECALWASATNAPV